MLYMYNEKRENFVSIDFYSNLSVRKIHSIVRETETTTWCSACAGPSAKLEPRFKEQSGSYERPSKKWYKLPPCMARNTLG